MAKKSKSSNVPSNSVLTPGHESASAESLKFSQSNSNNENLTKDSFDENLIEQSFKKETSDIDNDDDTFDDSQTQIITLRNKSTIETPLKIRSSANNENCNASILASAPPKSNVNKNLNNLSADKKQHFNQRKSIVNSHMAILEEIRSLYSASEIGLCEIAQALKVNPITNKTSNSKSKFPNSEANLSKQMLTTPIALPANKITVLVVGNHSAGKSSLINWVSI